jgi:hypothetical protein
MYSVYFLEQTGNTFLEVINRLISLKEISLVFLNEETNSWMITYLNFAFRKVNTKETTMWNV